MIKLIPFKQENIPFLLSWVDSEELLLQFAGPNFLYPLTHAQILNNIKAADKLCFGICTTGENRLIGYAEIAAINTAHKSARLSELLIGEKVMRNKGNGQILVKLLLAECFQELGLHRVALNVYDFNKPAIACYAKLGFKIEGLLRDTTFYKNEYWSGYEMSILSNEWNV